MQYTTFSQFTIPSLVWRSPHPTTIIPRRKTTSLQRFFPVLAVASPATPPSRHQATHSMTPEKLEVFKSLESWVFKNVLPLRNPVEKCWQPNEFLPDPSQGPDQFTEEVRALKHRVSGLSDEYFVMLVGNMLSEDTLPTYQTVINTWDGVRDETGSSSCPWAIWTRSWTAEENRHGDLLRTYVYLSGRVDMLMIEKTLQYTLSAGVDIRTENNPYLGFVYTSFQERATFLTHGNMARRRSCASTYMWNYCSGHENAYTRIVEKLLEVDPNATMLAIANMMKKRIAMPLQLDSNLYEHFSAVSQRLGIYTTCDYAKIIAIRKA